MAFNSDCYTLPFNFNENPFAVKTGKYSRSRILGQSDIEDFVILACTVFDTVPDRQTDRQTDRWTDNSNDGYTGLC